MLRIGVMALGIGWAITLAIGQGWIGHDSRLGWLPMLLFGAATLCGMEGVTDPEQRGRLFLLGAAGFASCLLYAVFRYFLLFSFAGG
jgi:hypothetical protein